MMRLYLYIFSLLVILGNLSACSGADPRKTSQSQKDRQPSQEQKHAGLKVMRVIIAGDAMEFQTGGIGNRVKYFHDKYKNRLKNQVIVAPGNEAQLKVDANDAVVHQSTEADIQAKVVEIVNTYSPERLVVFLATHGDRGGRLCYKTHLSCTFSADKMVGVINALDEANRKKSLSQRLKQLLIIPISCYNQAFAKSMLNILKKGAYKSFPVAISHMVEHGSEKCGGGMSVGGALFRGEIFLYEYKNNQIRDWALKDNRVDRIFNTKKLTQFVDLANEAINNNYNEGDKQRAALSSFSPHQKTQVFLDDFELELDRILIYNYANIDDPENLPVVAGHYNASPHEIVQSLIGIKRLEDAVSTIREDKSDYTKGSPQYNTTRSWPSGTSYYITVSLP